MKFIEIFITLSSTCGIHPADIESIIRVESNYCKYKISTRSSALGCGQILKVNQKLDEYKQLIEDDLYSIKRSVDIMCEYKRGYPRTWRGRYHIGRVPLTGDNLTKYNTYVQKLDIRNNLYFKTRKEILK